MSDYIPNELLTKIFAYLPVKSLVRFTCVDKSWHSLITSSDFINTHLNQTKLSDDNHILLLRYHPGHPVSESEQHFLYTDDDNFDQYEVFDFPFETSVYSKQHCHVVGSCNGLICLSHNDAREATAVVLWNPSIRKSLTLPSPQFTNQCHGDYNHVFGFGFDSRTNDYKVVRMVHYFAEGGHSEIYKLSTGSWVTITNIDPSYRVSNDQSQAFINGAVHWRAFKTGIHGRVAIIMSFDMSDEVFYELMLPASTEEECSWFDLEMSVAVCGEWLSYVRYHYRDNYKFCCSIWVMKEYGVAESWTKLYRFDLNGHLLRTLGFRRNGEILVSMRNKGVVVSYDPETHQIKYLHNSESCKFDRCRHPFQADAYVRSLVLL